MPAFPIIANPRPTVCSCPKLKCERHGNCGPCRAYHLNRRRPGPPRCERKPGLLSRLFGSL